MTTKPILITIPHELGAAEAKRRIAGGFARLADQLPGGGMAKVTESWSGDRMNFSVRAIGQSISGHVDVLDSAVQMEVQLPAILAALADKVRGRLQKAGQLLLTRK